MIEPIITSYENGRIIATHGQAKEEIQINIDQCSSSEYLQTHIRVAEKLARTLGINGRFYAAVGENGGYIFVRSFFEDDIAFKI